MRVLERAPRIEPVGAGIQLSANALRVLDRLGLLPALAPRGVEAGSVILRSARNGRVLATVPVSASDGIGYLAVHRADLQDCLLSAAEREPVIDIALATTLERFTATPDGVELAVREASGELRTEAAPILIGADGVRSAVAAHLGLPAPTDTGLVAARFVAPNVSGADRIEAWLGPKRHAVAYPMSGGRSVNIVLIAPGKAPVLPGFERWDPRLRTHLEKAEPVGSWPLLVTEPGRRLDQSERVCLIGDAAHAMLPFAAQGAAMAIEDGFVLARHLSGGIAREDVSGALSRFQSAREARLARVRSRVAFHRFVYHLPFPLSLGRDAAMAMRSPEKLRADLAWLYDWSPDEQADN